MILAFINNKGGVAKTTSAVNVAAALTGKNSRVLLIDLDSQGAASLSMGLKRADLRPSTADVLLHEKPIAEVVRQTSVPGLDLLPGSNELAAADIQLASVDAKEYRLKRVLDGVRNDYAHIIIDCPPSLSLMSVNALVAADYYIIPVALNYLTLGGMASLIEEVNALADRVNGDVAELMGFLLTMVDYRNGSTVNLAESVRAGWKELVFKTEIRVNVKLAEAPSVGKTIFAFAPGSTGAKAYKSLAKEVLNRQKALDAGEPLVKSAATTKTAAEAPAAPPHEASAEDRAQSAKVS